MFLSPRLQFIATYIYILAILQATFLRLRESRAR
jgi:hypothetical protein